MAQQTQIKTMLPYFERWMARFPDFRALAEASEAEVLKHWEGLGYYSRARNLQKLARLYLAADPKPTSRRQWQTLPGIGPYTSAAIASICFGEPVAVVDGNVVRLLARLTGSTEPYKSNAEAVRTFTGIAGQLVPSHNPGDHNQAMMEMGATVCLKRKPLCTLCPVNRFCKSRDSAALESIPLIERKATEHVSLERAWILHEGALLLHRMPDDAGQLAGQYELPRVDALPLSVSKGTPLALKTRSITNRRIKEHILRYPFDPNLPTAIRQKPDLTLLPVDELPNVTLSGPHRRWIKELLTKHYA